MWLQWPKKLRDLVYKTLFTNPLSVNLHTWLHECNSAPDFQFVLQTLSFGAPICSTDNRPRPRKLLASYDVDAHNHPSMRESDSAVDVQRILQEELDAGVLLSFPLRTLNPSAKQELVTLGFFDYIHPMGAIPKMEGTERVGTRIIQDYSFPRGNAINEHIDYLPMQFDKLETAAQYITAHPGCFAAKVDISGFFRHIPTHPCDWPLTTALWEFEQGPTLLVDTRMPFGLRHAPEVCCRISAVVKHTLSRLIKEAGLHGQVSVSNVVDDWLILAVRESVCRQVWEMLLSLLARLGFTLNHKKSVGPRQDIGWLGLVLRTAPCVGPPTVELPPDKLRKGKAMLQ